MRQALLRKRNEPIMSWKINKTSKKKVHRFDITIDDVTLPNNAQAQYSYVNFGKAVCILPITNDNKVVCLRQYRHPIRKWQWELPAGLVDPEDNDPLAAAKRELEEETGYQANTWIPMTSYYPSAGTITEHTYLYAATDLVKTQQRLEETEQLEVHEIGFEELKTLILTGEFQQGHGMAAVLNYILKHS
jgi:ADP-ribose pyrophosphatase